MQKISPLLWFDRQSEEAVNFFYASIFKNSRITDVARYGEAEAKASGRQGTTIMMTFELEGQQFMALNGGPVFKF